MNTYVILRRSAWPSKDHLKSAAERSAQVARQDFAGRVRWIRSYVLSEAEQRLGTVCIYQATDPEAIRAHARKADLPVDEIIQVANVVVMQPDPAE
ncbi:MAG TPA: DUF4242 domain-containing protein [Burkholderiales bacterium]